MYSGVALHYELLPSTDLHTIDLVTELPPFLGINYFPSRYPVIRYDGIKTLFQLEHNFVARGVSNGCSVTVLFSAHPI